MSTTRVTFGAVLGAVNDTATVVSSTLRTATKSVSMLESFVDAAATKQTLRIKADLDDFETALISEMSMMNTQRDVKTVEYLSASDEATKEIYAAHKERLTKLFARN